MACPARSTATEAAITGRRRKLVARSTRRTPPGSVGPCGNLDDILCEQIERKVGNDNCVKFEGISLQISADRHRCNYVKTKVRVHRYPGGSLALFHGPRRLANYTAEGKLVTTELKQAA